jgi:hypothetical protein
VDNVPYRAAAKHQARRLLEAAELHASDIETALDGAFAKTKTPHATYVASTPLERRLLNQTFFKRILVGENGTIEGAELTTVYVALANWEPSLGKPRHLTALPSPVKGSNKRTPTPFSRARVHTTTLCGASRARTGDLRAASATLSQLSYSPMSRPIVYRDRQRDSSSRCAGS